MQGHIGRYPQIVINTIFMSKLKPLICVIDYLVFKLANLDGLFLPLTFYYSFWKGDRRKKGAERTYYRSKRLHV